MRLCIAVVLQDAVDLAPEKPEASDGAQIELPQPRGRRQQGRTVHWAETAPPAPNLIAGGSGHASGGSRGGGPEAARTAGDEALAVQLAFGNDEGDSGRDDAQEVPQNGVKNQRHII